MWHSKIALQVAQNNATLLIITFDILLFTVQARRSTRVVGSNSTIKSQQLPIDASHHCSHLLHITSKPSLVFVIVLVRILAISVHISSIGCNQVRFFLLQFPLFVCNHNGDTRFYDDLACFPKGKGNVFNNNLSIYWRVSSHMFFPALS